ncbi:hypothetical protein FACS189496_4560 [Bacilli bacterium]|nr:hypothetical protein FACS189496_4560 [Bacilli bacterium]
MPRRTQFLRHKGYGGCFKRHEKYRALYFVAKTDDDELWVMIIFKDNDEVENFHITTNDPRRIQYKVAVRVEKIIEEICGHDVVYDHTYNGYAGRSFHDIRHDYIEYNLYTRFNSEWHRVGSRPILNWESWIAREQNSNRIAKGIDNYATFCRVLEECKIALDKKK